MSELAPRTSPAATDAAPAGPTVWILSAGEMHEGGNVLGVYLDRDLARGDFLAQAQEIHDRFSINDVDRDEDGALRVYGGCDWVALEPHTVVTRPQLGT